MRIISGRARGLKLNTPKTDDVRPTTDRIKESLFNIINSYIFDSVVLDLFAGSGALGLESISRGALECVFVDRDRESIRLLESNIKKSRFEKESLVMNMDFIDALAKLKLDDKKFDLVFIDPPYYKNMFIDAIYKIDEYDLIDNNSLVIVEHDYTDKFPEKYGRLNKFKEKKYGKTAITFYKMEEEDE